MLQDTVQELAAQEKKVHHRQQVFTPLHHSNLVMVLQATKKQGGGHCIEVLYNGMRVELPGCHHTQGLCSLETFLVSGFQ